MKCTQYGLYGQVVFKNVRADHAWGRPGFGAETLAFSMLPLPAALMSAMLVRGI